MWSINPEVPADVVFVRAVALILSAWLVAPYLYAAALAFAAS